jgi:hypothetical protein
MEQSFLVCNCSHFKKFHLNYNGCMHCVCMYFIPNNLKYLEMISKEKEVADLNKI